MSPGIASSPRPGTAFIRVADTHQPWIAGYRCPDCGAVALDKPLACRRCSSRKSLLEFHAAERGRIYTWTVVERSYPGVAVPFVSVIVDLDDGLTLKGTLREHAAGAERSGMRVRLLFDDAGGARDADGVPYVGYHFVPLEEAAQ